MQYPSWDFRYKKRTSSKMEKCVLNKGRKKNLPEGRFFGVCSNAYDRVANLFQRTIQCKFGYINRITRSIVLIFIFMDIYNTKLYNYRK